MQALPYILLGVAVLTVILIAVFGGVWGLVTLFVVALGTMILVRYLEA